MCTKNQWRIKRHKKDRRTRWARRKNGIKYNLVIRGIL
jgi:hypothetical protein